MKSSYYRQLYLTYGNYGSSVVSNCTLFSCLLAKYEFCILLNISVAIAWNVIGYYHNYSSRNALKKV